MKAPRSPFAAAAGAALIALGLCLLASCASAPVEVPADLPARILVQRAQEASDRYDYDTATAYYRALGERFGSDPTHRCTAEYEIAFIDYKQGRIAEARTGLEALLARYAEPGAESLPPHYRILALKVLEKIDAEGGKKKGK